MLEPVTVAAAYGLAAAVASGLLFYLRSLPEAPAGIAWWGAATAVSGLRALALGFGFAWLPQLAQSLGEALQAVTALLLLAGTQVFLGQRPRFRLLVAVCLAAIALSLYGLMTRVDAILLTALLGAASGSALAFTGGVFLRHRPAVMASGYRFAGGAFVLWGLVWLLEAMLGARGIRLPVLETLALGAMLTASAALAVIVVQRVRAYAVAAEALARENHLRAQSIIDATPDPMLIGRAGWGGLLYANQRAAEQFGIGLAELLSRGLRDFFVDDESCTRLLDQLGRHGKADGHEVRLRTARGKPFWALVSARPLVFEGEQAVLMTCSDISERKTLEDQLRRLATTDALTGTASRRHFFEQAEGELKRARRYRHPMSLLLMDIDHFKTINDTYGHAKGDHVLRLTAAFCRGVLRAHDVLGRLGGEEFAIALPETDYDGAFELAERLRAAVAEQEVADTRGNFRYSISIGVTELGPTDTIESGLHRADAALYSAKRLGRNRVCGDILPADDTVLG